ncbi:hypothetical protein dqs_2725 [Azoarcus olearius]|uniref:CBS domain-containing protein n=1 Tax=Azoarcus sp. (strain BH72) TaxID=418699 RepID=UPI0008063AE6|nr:CBS domain-containing protein [Azoarcus olearius]ANQ85755.1 hypothetical protein dqs_2725 [Azoarcus olearius]
MLEHAIRAIVQNRRCVTVPDDMSVRRVAELMRVNHISAVLVTDLRSNTLKGICTERDIVFGVVASGKDAETVGVGSIMTRSPQVISPDRPFSHALHLMYEGQFHHVPVVECGAVVGILSAKDADGYDARQFEGELVRREEITAIL